MDKLDIVSQSDFSNHLKFLIEEAHQTAKDKGWHDPEVTIPHAFMMIIDELAETLHEYRKSPINTTKVYEEIADVFIRLFDFMGSRSLDGHIMALILLEKMRTNRDRPHRHGDKPF